MSARNVNVVPLDFATARVVGQLCGSCGHSDVVDVHVTLHAKFRHCAVVTTDPDDMAKVDPTLPIITL